MGEDIESAAWEGTAVFMYSDWDIEATADPKAFVGLDSGGNSVLLRAAFGFETIS